MPESDRERWNRKFNSADYVLTRDPEPYLVRNLDMLPAGGRALDLAAGEGRHAAYLAELGFETDAVDISETGLAKGERLAYERGVVVRTIRADLTEYTPAPNAYDLIVNFNYLERKLVPRIRAALKPGGIVVFETYTVALLDIKEVERREYLLELGELPELFRDFEIMRSHEHGDARRERAGLVARNPVISCPLSIIGDRL